MNEVYGIWIPFEGWLKVNGDAVAFDIRVVAESTAIRIGKKSRVEFVDDSLVQLEGLLIEAEKEKYNKSYSVRFKKWVSSLIREPEQQE